MRLPLAEQAFIPPQKLRDYLLSPTHPVGRFKAAFLEWLGYRQAGWRRLEADIRAQILPLDAEQVDTSPYGTKYRVAARLTGAHVRIVR